MEPKNQNNSPLTSKQYFVKTFFFVFVFYTVYKAVYQAMSGLETITVDFIIKTLGIGFVVAAVLGGINYFAKVNFFTRKN
jgi:succinate dehydrogenase hydrophobic anchor subunit